MEKMNENAKNVTLPAPSATAEMEFRLIDPTEDGFVRKIQWNRAELETAIIQKVSQYENIVYTEENMKQAKADRAELNKLSKAIDTRRKKVKNIVMQPYSIFEGEVKEILALINEQAAAIDATVKDYEQHKRDEKRQQIYKVYEESIGSLTTVLPFEKVLDPKYLNVSYPLSNAQKAVKDAISQVKNDLDTINRLDSKYRLNVQDVYINTLSMSKAMAEHTRLSALEEKLMAEKAAKQRRMEEEAARKEMERRSQETAQRKEPADTPNPIPSAASESTPVVPASQNAEEAVSKSSGNTANTAATSSSQQNDPFADADTDTRIYKSSFTIHGTKAQILSVREFLEKNNIPFGTK